MMDAMDGSRLLGEVSRVLEGDGDRERKAAGIAEAIRRSGGHRWVGLYEVTEDEIANLAFDGTRSEIIVPVADRAGRKVVGTIDVESEQVNAFSEEDRVTLERCAAAV